MLNLNMIIRIQQINGHLLAREIFAIRLNVRPLSVVSGFVEWQGFLHTWTRSH